MIEVKLAGVHCLSREPRPGQLRERRRVTFRSETWYLTTAPAGAGFAEDLSGYLDQSNGFGL
ncbi:MAG: hypothetical protein K0R41_528 [Geminicoccaceae bacterium]|jgi:hypothetical protein|nr:hypothetical protein [Geminicoccaceae bacterium]